MTLSRLVLFILCIALLGFGGKPGLRFDATGGVSGVGDPASRAAAKTIDLDYAEFRMPVTR